MRSLTVRILLIVGGAVLFTALATTSIGALAIRDQLDAQAKRNFQRQVDGLATVVASGSGATRLYYLDAGGLVALAPDAALPEPLAQLREQLREELAKPEPASSLSTAAGEVLLAVRETPSGPVALARKASFRPRSSWSLWTDLLLPALAGAIVAGVTALLLARRLVRPLRDLSRASARIAHGDLGARVEVAGGDELAQLATSFNAMAEELARSRERERELILAVSHDFRTPLTSVRGYAEALGEGVVEPGLAAEAIGQEASRLDRLVCDLLDLGRSGQGALSFEIEPVELATLAADLEARFGRIAAEHGLDLSVHSEDAGSVLADRDRLLQVASNLVENAIRATPAGGTVTVSAEPGRLEVRDTGPGLDRAEVVRAFERYFLYDRYRDRREVGTGLGLAIVKELTEGMGGQVRLESEPGSGAAFVVELPPAPAGRTARSVT